jgi:hypothetical protein
MYNERQSTALFDDNAITEDHKMSLKSIHFLTANLVSICIDCSTIEIPENTVFTFENESGECKPMYFLAHADGNASTLCWLMPGKEWPGQLMEIHEGFAGLCNRTIKPLQVPSAHYQFFIGDESSIGIFDCLLKSLSLLGQSGIGLMLISDDRHWLPDRLDFLLDVAINSNGTYSEVENYFWQLPPEISSLRKFVPFHLAGTSEFVMEARDFILSHGVSEEQILTY